MWKRCCDEIKWKLQAFYRLTCWPMKMQLLGWLLSVMYTNGLTQEAVCVDVALAEMFAQMAVLLTSVRGRL